MKYFFSRSIVFLFLSFQGILAFGQVNISRDVLLCPGETINVYGTNYNTADTFSVIVSGFPDPDTNFTYRLQVLSNVANATACNCHPKSFFKVFGRENQTELGTALCKSSDGNVYLTGRKSNRTFIQKMNTSGEVIWLRDFAVSIFEPITPAEIFEDADGMLVGCGTQGLGINQRKGFVFKYNPETNVLIWSKTISSSNPASIGILENGPKGNYLYYQNPTPSSGDIDAEILEIERNTGNIIPTLTKRYEYKGADMLSKVLRYDANTLYATGASTVRTGVNDASHRQLLSQISLFNGSPVWSQINHLDTNATGDLYGRDLIVDGNALIALYEGAEDTNLAGTNTAIYLQKSDLQGNRQWLHRYQLPGNAFKLLSDAQGYLLYGQLNANTYFFIKTDKDGIPVWAKRLVYGPAGAPTPKAFGPAQALALGDAYLFTGVTSSGLNDVFLLRLNSDGTMSDSCAYLENIDLDFQSITDTTRNNIILSTKLSTAIATSNNFTPVVSELFEQFLCPDCIKPDPCPAGNDFIVHLNENSCSNGVVNLQLSICDLDGGALPKTLNVAFYDGNPTLGAANNLSNFIFNNNSQDSCVSFSIPDLSSEFGTAFAKTGAQIYVVVNFDGVLSAPFSFDDFPVTDYEECNYTNNIDSITLQLPAIPVLNLGPDRSICIGETAILTPGPIFYKYQWSNGSANDTLLIKTSSQFSLTVTDVCGGKQSDQIAVVVKQLPVLAKSGTLCPGQSIQVYGFTFKQGGTFVDTIPAVVGNACDTVITFTITQLPYQTREEQVFFCPGTKVTINGVTYEESGLARDTVSASAGCDTVVTYFLNQLPKPFRFDSAYICPGGSITINGKVYTQPGLIVDTLPSSSGLACDTFLRLQLFFRPQAQKDSTIRFCPGQSVLIGNQSYNTPGTVEGILPGLHGDCDTIVHYTLVYTAPQPSKVTISCPANIEVAVLPGAGPKAVLYNQPSTTSTCLCTGIDLELQSGPASGGLFPIGTTQVCYVASDYCNATATCCFKVKVKEESACDVKTTACVKYELLSITSNVLGQYTYSMRVTNNCSNKLIYTAIELPAGITALSPGNNNSFTTPEGQIYTIRNPNYSPFYSIRFKSTGDSIANGQSATFSFTLPKQIRPAYFNLTTRLFPQAYYEAYLNTFNCPVGITPSVQSRESEESAQPETQLEREANLLLYPNPSSGVLFADLSPWNGQELKLRVLNNVGQCVQQQRVLANDTMEILQMGATALPGLYLLEICTQDGKRYTAKFVLKN
jgi:hypothetical protein